MKPRSYFFAVLLLSLCFPLAASAISYLPGQTLNPSCPPTDPTCVVVPNTTSGSFIATSSNATSTFAGNVAVSGNVSIGSLSGILRAVAGVITNTLVNLTSDVTGILGISNGGTGISSAPAYGQLLVGNGSGGYTLTSTSSLGVAASSVAWGSITGTLSNQADLQSALNAKLASSSLSATYPLAYNSSTGVFSSAFSTTTANTFSAFQIFNGGASTTNATSTNLFASIGNFTTAVASTFSASLANIVSFTATNSTTTNATTTNLAVTGTGYFAGNVGIGTTTPGSPLSVAGVANFTTATSTVYSSGGFNITQGCYAVNGICVTAGGGGLWGSITGTLANQTDLQSALNAKLSSTSLSATYPLAYNSATGVFSTNFSTTTANTFSNANVFNGNTTLANATSTNFFSTTASSTNLYAQIANLGTLSLANALGIASGGTNATSLTQGQLLSFNGTSFVSTSTIGNNQLVNSSISGVALGQNLAALTATNGSLTFSGSYNGSTAQTVGLNLGNANSWTGLQSFGNASSTLATLTTAWFSGITNGILSTNASGQVVATTSIGTNLLTGTLGTINGAAFTIGSSITTPTASSTELSDNNTFSGTDVFTHPLSLTGTTGTTTIAAGQGFTIGGSQFVVQQGSGNIGIGTTTPGSPLSVAGVANFTTATSTVYSSGGFNITQGCYAVNGICVTAGGGGLWGSITGTLANQTDLQSALNAKLSSTSLSATYPLAYNSATGVFSTNFSTTTANTFSNANVFNGNTTLANATSTNFFSTTASSTNLYAQIANLGTLSLANALGIASGGTNATSLTQGQLLSFNGTSFVSTSTIGNNQLVNSSISGVALGQNLAALTATNGSLTFSGSYNGSTAQTVGLNLGNANSWTGLQSFGNASSTLATLTTAWFSGITNGILSTNASGQVVATTSIGTNLLTGTLGTINGAAFTIGSSITTPTASSTELSDNNTFSGTDVFTHPLSLTGTTGTTTIAAGQGFTIGGSQFVVQQGSGNIGIGTTSPIDLLHIPGLSQPIMAGTVSSGANGPISVYVQGRYAYLSNQNNSTLFIFDISNPAAPVEMSSISTGLNQQESVYVQGRYAYVASYGNSSLVIFDISNPAAPVKVGSTTSGLNGPISVYVQGRYAYVTSYTNSSLVIFDISNPANPVNVGSTTSGLSTPGFAYVQGRYAYVVSDGNNSLVMFDISNPAAPVKVGSTTSGLNDPGSVYVQGRYAYVTSYNNNAFVIFDVSNPTAPVNVGSTTSGLFHTWSVSVQGRYAYVVSGGNNSLVVFDVSNPTAPVNVGSTSSGLSLPVSVFVQGRYAYVASNSNGALATFNIGGEYTQSLEAGSIQAGSLSLDNNLQALDGEFAGGLTVGNNLNVGGSFALNASTFYATTTAGQAGSIFSINTASSTTPLFNVLYNGNVGIGTTTPYSSRLEVFGSDAASSTSAFAVVNTSSTTVFAVFDGGNAQLSGTLTQSSDQRLKTNIQSLDGSSSLAKINALNPITYNWIDPNQDNRPQLGFIAQQVQGIFPGLVSTTSATALTPGGTLGLNYIDLISPIVAAIQELDKEITTLASAVENFATSITTQQLCVSNGPNDPNPVCVTKSQLAAVLASANQSASAPASPSSSPSGATNTPPVIQINGDDPAIIEVGATYTDLGATITGPQADINLGIQTYLNGAFESPIELDTSTAATDTIAYVVTDTQGLTSTSTRTVIVEPAAAPPASPPTPSIDASSSATTTVQ